MVVCIIVALLCITCGIGIRIVEYRKLKQATEQQALTSVRVMLASHGPLFDEIQLPSNVIAWHEATIFARTSGYVIKWLVDIGARVKAGDLLAIIDIPEVKAQLRQTQADLKTAQTNYQLAKVTEQRWLNLAKTDSVSKQETVEKVSDANAKASIVAATRATKERLQTLVEYSRVIAPFDGIIMSRNTDIGRLINAGNTGTMPLFRLVQANFLRVYVKVPQNYVANIKPGLVAKLHFADRPGKYYFAKLLDTAKAIDPISRTLLAQFVIDNRHYELLPGSYALLHLNVPIAQTTVRLPVSTIIFRAQGLQIATVNKNNQAVLKNVTMGRDFGDEVEITAGLEPKEMIILNPSDSLYNGEKVRVVK